MGVVSKGARASRGQYRPGHCLEGTCASMGRCIQRVLYNFPVGPSSSSSSSSRCSLVVLQHACVCIAHVTRKEGPVQEWTSEMTCTHLSAQSFECGMPRLYGACLLLSALGFRV